MPWQPFGLNGSESAEWEVLLPGVPTWLRAPLVDWVRLRVASNVTWLHAETLLDAQAALRVELGGAYGRGGIVEASRVMPIISTLDDQQLLALADWLLAHKQLRAAAVRLDGLLDAARSRYKVGTRFGRPGLVERVPEGVQASVENTIATTGNAGQVLARAWAHVHGLNPNDTTAYTEAVKAVEIAAVGKVQPKHSEATFGTVLGQMRSDGDWRLPLREHDQAPSAELVLAMMRTLWRGHRDRHGSPTYTDVTHEEAQAAVVLAASLIDWFESEALTRRPS